VIPVSFLIPGDLSLPTGGYRYDREVLARLDGFGVKAAHVALPAGYPAPSVEDIAVTESLLAAADRRTPLLIDGLALGAMPPMMLQPYVRRLVALVHHPLGLESGLAPERAAFLLANEKAVLALAARVIVTSRTTAETLVTDFAVPERRIAVAEPGVDRASRADAKGQPPHLLAVGAVSARKAYPDLVAALATLTDLDWRLTIAGALDRDAEAVAALHAEIERQGLAGRVTLAGAVTDECLAALYASGDIFVVSSLYEGYGMALAEALARGLPLVASTGGAAAATAPDAAALKFNPGDRPGLAAALRRMLGDAALRRRMSDAAWAAAALLPTWDDAAREIAMVLKAVHQGEAP
jgi:glycosyltransferase involved in cell wall biosynthesis